ncbi:MAG: hemerythrin family protein [Coxiellaceae bacterium]|nr:hemerythrin family protein [Coxiellaceae bacterium]
MPIFQWTEELDVGVDKMNNEHIELIALMNKVYDLSEAKAQLVEINIALDAFITYTKKHFSDEEAYMESIGYGEIEDHKQKHRKLFEDLTTYIDDFSRTGTLDDGFFQFLKMWLRGHIIYIDGKYKKFAAELASTD